MVDLRPRLCFLGLGSSSSSSSSSSSESPGSENSSSSSSSSTSTERVVDLALAALACLAMGTSSRSTVVVGSFFSFSLMTAWYPFLVGWASSFSRFLLFFNPWPT